MSACADLALLCDTIPHIVWGASADGAVDYVNSRGIAYAGVDLGGLAGDSWLKLLHPDDAAATRRSWRAAARRGGDIELDVRIRGADGGFQWFRFHGAPVRDDAGRPVRWFGTCTDVDSQRAAEQRLREAQQEAQETLRLLDVVQSAAPIGLGFGDRDCRYVRVNEQLATINGLPRDEHPGRSIADVLPEFWPAIEPVYRGVLETGAGITHRPMTMSTADGHAQLLVSYYPVRVDEAIVGVGFVVVDITELSAAEAERAAVINHMAEGLVTTDSKGMVTCLNRAAAYMLGWCEEELLGRPLHEVAHAASPGKGHAADECSVIRAAAASDHIEGEDTYLRKDGTTFEATYSASPVRVGNAVTGVVVVFRDVTDAKHRQRQELEGRHDQKLEALGRLSAGLAHEINTPIQFVGDNTRFLAEAYQTMLELLLVYRECMGPASGQLPWEERKQRAEDAEEKADIDYLAEEVPGAVEQSLEGIDRVASLVRAMKAFSYKDTKEHSYADLNEGIRTTVIVARNEVKYVADVVLDLGELPDVLCSLGDLNQVFLNLLVNAADAMPEQGPRGEIKISTRVEGSMVVIKFADNGSGIPEEIRKTIFDPFFTTKEVGKGTGQGLALAIAVCEKHGGAIEVNSEVGVGTEFVLTLPISGRRGVAA